MPVCALVTDVCILWNGWLCPGQGASSCRASALRSRAAAISVESKSSLQSKTSFPRGKIRQKHRLHPHQRQHEQQDFFTVAKLQHLPLSIELRPKVYLEICLCLSIRGEVDIEATGPILKKSLLASQTIYP